MLSFVSGDCNSRVGLKASVSLFLGLGSDSSNVYYSLCFLGQVGYKENHSPPGLIYHLVISISRHCWSPFHPKLFEFSAAPFPILKGTQGNGSCCLQVCEGGEDTGEGAGDLDQWALLF